MTALPTDAITISIALNFPHSPNHLQAIKEFDALVASHELGWKLAKDLAGVSKHRLAFPTITNGLSLEVALKAYDDAITEQEQ